ncbi:hypothetical protein NG895_22970 [Aeoliella sp. ICT_H6.2]|uniref:Secreted protein n=1 Tax=Aeoliella straminimaris TaxID=2954799 RepID=A0A9X2FD61_9BACT|nr:hypothetical protein [Aeoliella straminimaris]MCO6046770.1 hypothetical protein [Aeoliella straminimaris]
MGRYTPLAIVLALPFLLLSSSTGCAPESGMASPPPADPIAAIGYEDVDFDVTHSEFRQAYRGAVDATEDNAEHGVAHYAIQDHGSKQSVVGFQFLDEQLMSIITSHFGDRIAELGGVDTLMQQTVDRFGAPHKVEGERSIWTFPNSDRTITATSPDGMWVLAIERTSLKEQLQDKIASAIAQQIVPESTPASEDNELKLTGSDDNESEEVAKSEEEEPQNGWVFWKPTAEDLAEIEAELAAEQRATTLMSTFGTGSRSSPPTYRVLEREEFSLPGKRRYQLRIRVQGSLSKSQIDSICREILASNTQYTSAHAVEFLFYLPDSDHHGHFTAGKAIWGEWSTMSAATGGKRLNITAGNALGTRSSYGVKTTSLSTSKKQQIFWDLVKAQDTDMDPDLSYVVVASRHGVTEKQARAIAQEGIHKGWPMP